MVPVCIILAALLVPVQSRQDNATGSPALSHSFIRLQQRMKQQQQYSVQTNICGILYTHTHTPVPTTYVCVYRALT
jgi:hypothetical protein